MQIAQRPRRSKDDVVRMTDNGPLMVRLELSGIPLLVVICDQLKVMSYPGAKYYYLELADAIRWHESEAKKPGHDGWNRDLLAALKLAEANLGATVAA